MTDENAFAALGRKLRLGVIGGGQGSFIAPVHRAAALLDGRFEISAGVLSSDPEKSVRDAAALGIPRGYSTVDAMLEAEAGRDEGIDAVAIMTPNDRHFAQCRAALDRGLHVICDKPLTNTADDAMALVRRVRETGLVFCLTHNYSGYPMVREARVRVRSGALGDVRLVRVSYAQGRLATRVEAGEMPSRLRWRLDPAQGGESHVLLDIGTHAHQLAEFITGLRVTSVMAEVGAVMPGREVHDTASALMRLENDARGILWSTKAANGAPNALEMEVYGEGGGLAWSLQEADIVRLRREGAPEQVLRRGQDGLSEVAQRATRLPLGHPEGFHEAFANLYADFAEAVACAITGRSLDPLVRGFPGVEDGARGVAFCEACVASSREGGWKDLAPV